MDLKKVDNNNTYVMKNNTIFCLLAIIIFVGCKAPTSKSVYPAEEWEKKVPGKMGMDMSVLVKIDSLMKVSEANGVLIYKGYLVDEWNYGGPANQTYEVQSITKSITSTVLALALYDGLIPSLDAKVKDYWPDFEAGPYTNEITFRHLVTASSGIKSTITKGTYYDPNNMKPGIESRYHNDHFHQLAAALTYIYGKELGEVLKDRILVPLQAQDIMRWGYHKSEGVTCANGKQVKIVGGYAYSHWTARDLARVGYLYLNNGKWKGEQLLPAEYTKEARRPIPIPVMDKNPDADPDQRWNGEYGLGWRGMPCAEGKTLWYMSGNGGQFCVVIPEYELVMTKINSYAKRPHRGLEQFDDLLWRIFDK